MKGKIKMMMMPLCSGSGPAGCHWQWPDSETGQAWARLTLSAPQLGVTASAFPPGPIPPAGSVGSYPSRERDIRRREERIIGKPFIVLLDCCCFLMVAKVSWSHTGPVQNYLCIKAILLLFLE